MVFIKVKSKAASLSGIALIAQSWSNEKGYSWTVHKRQEYCEKGNLEISTKQHIFSEFKQCLSKKRMLPAIMHVWTSHDKISNSYALVLFLHRHKFISIMFSGSCFGASKWPHDPRIAQISSLFAGMCVYQKHRETRLPRCIVLCLFCGESALCERCLVTRFYIK